VPTDPFVPADPDAKPRQQQNLPPGVALPPASDWRPNRPGDLGPEQPRGPLFGAPGPNVGFAYTLADRARERFQLGSFEDFDDAKVVVAEVAGKRAALFGRAPVMADIDRALALLGYDGSASTGQVEQRSFAVREASHSYPRRRALVDVVPEKMLRVPVLDAADVGAWRAEMLAGFAGHPVL
jgi:hypothetical protein